MLLNMTAHFTAIVEANLFQNCPIARCTQGPALYATGLEVGDGLSSQDRRVVQLRRAVHYRARHLTERRVPRLDVVVIRLDAVEVRAAVLPQPVPQVHGVVAPPVEPATTPDQLQLVEVRSVDAVLVHVHQVWETPCQVERHLRQYHRPIYK